MANFWYIKIGVSHTVQIMKRWRKYPLPNHILSYSETSPKERECSNGEVGRRNDEQKTV